MIIETNKHLPKYYAIVPAAGIGSRMRSERPKQYLCIHDKTILEHTLNVLLSYKKIEKIIVVLADNDFYWPSLELPHKEKIITTIGGEQRFLSVLNGLQRLKDIAHCQDWVLVHDAVRPCLQHSDLDLLIDQIAEHPTGGLLGAPVADTLKKVNAQNEVISTVDRTELWQAMTPQMFRYQKLFDALNYCSKNNLSVTDSASAIAQLNEPIKMVHGRRDNIKITFPEDVEFAENILDNISSLKKFSEGIT